ncbi:hypothetical protein [Clostridium sp.]|uniref:hypothetical protein n=1 Tax=Clostridium sp. TaxID=1506 RepID=UPI0025B8A343|nr:hypothetical protein [Clostridium sp.]
MSHYVTKCDKLSMEGKINASNYLNKDRVKKYKIDIILEDFDFIDNKPNIV